LTVDYAAAAMFLDAMEPEMMPIQGTDLGEALRMSLDALDQGAREDRIIVLVTDGEDHEGQIEAQVQRAVANGVRIHTVGIGSTEGVPIPVTGAQGGRQGFVRDEEGNVVTTRLDEATLRQVADATGGQFVRVAPGTTAFEDLVDEIAAGEGEELDSREITQFEEQYQLFLAFAFALLVIEALVPERRKAAEAWSGRFE
jgi:Ca-activated chloride channel family protein